MYVPHLNTPGYRSILSCAWVQRYNRLTYVIKSLGDILDTLGPAQKYLIIRCSFGLERKSNPSYLRTEPPATLTRL